MSPFFSLPGFVSFVLGVFVQSFIFSCPSQGIPDGTGGATTSKGITHDELGQESQERGLRRDSSRRCAEEISLRLIGFWPVRFGRFGRSASVFVALGIQ